MKLLKALCLALVICLSGLAAHAEELTVSAAASLTDAFTDIEAAFEAAHPDVDVIMNFASSGALYRQIEQGAPVDVYASANPKWMDKAETNEFMVPGTRQNFVTNSLVLITPTDNPAQVATVNDLLEERVTRVSLGTPDTVPAGQYAKTSLESLSLYETLEPKYIFAENVRQVLDYVLRGEVDAAFVYRTDAIQAGDEALIIETMPLDEPPTYPIAVMKTAANAEMSQAFVDFVLGPDGQAMLQARGFSPAQ